MAPPAKKPFRFGIVAAQVRAAAEWKDLATRAEAAGYSSLLLPDTSGPVLSPFSALSVAAAVTSTLRVGNWVLANDFRNPVLVAREAATLDFLSEGRLELGFGAGRDDNDYASLGLTEPESGGARLKRLAESLEIIQRLFSGETLSFSGKHYTVANATLYPTPARPIPILMAAARPKSVELAGRRADIVALGSSSREYVLQQVDRLRSAAGERFPHIQLATITWVVPEGNAAAREVAATMLKRLGGWDLESMIADQAPNVLTGSSNEMVEQLEERRAALGLSYFVVNQLVAEAFAPVVERLAGH